MMTPSSFHHPLLFSSGIYRVAPDASTSLLVSGPHEFLSWLPLFILCLFTCLLPPPPPPPPPPLCSDSILSILLSLRWGDFWECVYVLLNRPSCLPVSFFTPLCFSPCLYLLAFIDLFWSPCLHLFGFSFLRLLTVCDNTSFVFLVSSTLSCFAIECLDDPISLFCLFKNGSRPLSNASLGCFSPLISWTQEQWLSSHSVEALTRHYRSVKHVETVGVSTVKVLKILQRTVNVRCTQRCDLEQESQLSIFSSTCFHTTERVNK